MKIYLLILFFSLSLSVEAKEINHLKKLCFTTVKESELCLNEDNSTILMPKNLRIEEHIYILQTVIRAFVDADKKSKLILVSEEFDGILLYIAQANLLPFYRKQIHGIVLKNTPANFNDKAYDVETLKALSPALQMDWNNPKVVLLALEDKKQKKLWEDAFRENEIVFEFKDDFKKLNLETWFPLKKSSKIQPKERLEIPQHYGAILRFHLGKIAYKSKHKIIHKEKIYGLEKEQKYDVFYKKGSKNNPLFIYVHGGGWDGGKKEDFHGLCKQYTDKGFTSVSINYRLLDLPRVGMKEMITDVKIAIESILNSSKKYKINKRKTMLMADSAGALLAYMAMSQLNKKYAIKAAIFNSIPTNLKFFSKEKQITLSGIKEDGKRKVWSENFSPFFHLIDYRIPTLAIHSLDDKVVVAEHLENLEIQSVIYHNNISSLWIENSVHPISPKENSLQLSYVEIEERIDGFMKDILE